MTLVDSVQEFVVYLAVHIAVTAAKRIPAYVPEDAQVVENGFSESTCLVTRLRRMLRLSVLISHHISGARDY